MVLQITKAQLFYRGLIKKSLKYPQVPVPVNTIQKVTLIREEAREKCWPTETVALQPVPRAEVLGAPAAAGSSP